MPCVTEDPEASGGTVLVPPILPLDALLPIRAAVVTLAFTAAAAPRFFHQPAVTAFLRTLLGGPEDYDLLLTMDCPETGRIAYRAGDRYRFTLFALAGGEALLDRALAALRRLPESFPLRDPALPFRDNISFIELRDLFNGEPVRGTGDLSIYDETALVREAALWAHAEQARLRFLAPARLLLDKPQRGTRRGEARYCRNGRELSLALFFCRLHDSFADLLRRRGIVPPPRPPAPALPPTMGHLFWVDASYRDAAGREQAMGGLTGLLDLPADPRPSLNLWRLLVLGQYTGIGQRRAFGFGRYRLETGNGDWTAARADPAASLLELAAEPDNLLMAYQAIEDNRRARRPRPEEREEWEADPGEDEDALEDEGPDEDLADRLGRLSARLRGGGYRPPALRGFVLEGADGKPRPLAVPPYLDRIAQRAVTQVLTPALDELMAPGSHGYRRGRSRHSAARAIEAAYARGCRFVYEADIDDFFDSVDWRRLGITLAALLGDDPVVERVLSWVAAPVEYRGTAIPRREGLPQGAPLSPLLANLVLDSFDGALERAAFASVRFADNFVIACKTEAEARRAAEAAVAALAQIGLAVNPDESRIVSFAQGFRFLGYLFVDGLALDTAGEREPATEIVARRPPPPRSWLARLPAAVPTPPAAPRAAAPVPAPGSSGAEEGAVLFVTGAPALLRTRAGRLAVERGGVVEADLAWNGLAGLCLIGAHHLTGPATRAALRKGVPVHYASGTGRYLGTLRDGRPGAEGHGLWLLQAQCCADPGRALRAARNVVEARLRHLREVLRQRVAASPALSEIDKSLGGIATAPDLPTLNGLEGYATRAYFAALAEALPEWMGFEGRVKRPPRDPFNAMLSLGYTVLYQHVETVIRTSGLLPFVGFYHQGHGRHAALASDLMEPFRHLVERTALGFALRGRVGPADFRDDAARGCRFTPEALRLYLAALGTRFDTPITALGGNDPKTLHGHLRDQNRALIDWLRGRRPEFQAFRMR